MLDLTKIYLFLFGVLSIAGGVMGFVNKASKASLIAGSISGLALLIAGYLIGTGKVQPGLILGVVVCVALAGRFVPAFLRGHEFWPAGTMAICGVIGIVLTVLSLVKR